MWTLRCFNTCVHRCSLSWVELRVHLCNIPHSFILHFTLHSAEKKIRIEFSANYPFTTFRIPYSAFRKIPLPQFDGPLAWCIIRPCIQYTAGAAVLLKKQTMQTTQTTQTRVIKQVTRRRRAVTGDHQRTLTLQRPCTSHRSCRA